ncbi:MAG: tetratricopeptide repeat protein [Akkermansiaceae bacterium]
MKNIITTIVVALIASAGTLSAQSDADSKKVARARSFYTQGTTAMRQGKYDLAKASFREVLKIYPKHPQARRQLQYILANQSSLSLNKRKRVLQGVTIPKVSLEDESLQESIDFLAAAVRRNSKDGKSPNFVVQDPTGAFSKRKVTLNLSNIPASALLKYITDQCRGVVSYQKHAIIIRPNSPAKPKVTPSAKADTADE